MGRREKPLPDDAPAAVRAFAQDLRTLRARARLTLDQLAVKSGYPKSRLSEAASGSHLPTEDLLRAFVGACGGGAAEQDLWARRLHDLRGDPDVARWIGGRTAAEATPSPDRSRRPFLPAIAAVATLVAAVLAAVVAYRDLTRPPAPEPSVACPDVAPGAAFLGVTKLEAGALVRQGASRDFPVLRTIPTGCQLAFGGYCLGDPVMDPAADLPDVRWFLPSDGPGVIASAVIRGNPPVDLAPSECLGEDPLPSGVTLVGPQQESPPGADLQLAAEAPGAALVGFAAKYTDPNGAADRRWRQIGLIVEGPPFQLQWDPPDRLVQGAEALPVAAVVCMAGEAPTELVDAGDYMFSPEPRPATVRPSTLTGADRQAARQAACRYPD
jgi:transcriptional regulator with XRE-family HTH domain